ncbi:hypothetical protein L917_19324, partial [Phytophthora nicotianae]
LDAIYRKRHYNLSRTVVSSYLSETKHNDWL